MSDGSTSRLAEVIHQAARTINTPRSVRERLQAIVDTAPGTVVGFDAVSISLADSQGKVETRAASCDVVWELDSYQYEVEEGPCFDAFSQGGIVTVPSLQEESRWPHYAPRAVGVGVTAQIAVPLGGSGEVTGALNLYSTIGEGIDPEAPGIAALFATHVALALGWARTEEQLSEALGTRKRIGQAIGIVMERYQINEEKAFGFLTRVSQTGNVKLRDVAHELVGKTDARYTVKDT